VQTDFLIQVVQDPLFLPPLSLPEAEIGFQVFQRILFDRRLYIRHVDAIRIFEVCASALRRRFYYVLKRLL
jgi:hypothetical protein